MTLNLEASFARSTAPSVLGTSYIAVYAAAASDAARCPCSKCKANLEITPTVYALALLGTVGPADPVTTTALRTLHTFITSD